MQLSTRALLSAGIVSLLTTTASWAGFSCTNDYDCEFLDQQGDCSAFACIEGGCQEVNAPAGTYCGPLVQCLPSPGDCTNGGLCNASGGCVTQYQPDGYDCSNGCDNATCQSGTCVAGTPVVCGEIPCQQNLGCQPMQYCNSGSWGCQYAPVADDTACTDGNDCTEGDSCLGGSCAAGTPVADDTVCDDGVNCTTSDVCTGGSCGGTAVDCSNPGDCRTTTCDEATGECGIADADTACGDGGTTLCNDPDSCDDAGNCLANLSECGLVTGGGTCLFDTNAVKGVCEDGSACVVGQEGACEVGDCLPSREFRLVLTPDVQQWPAHKLNASNPGQFRYNVFAAGTPGETQTTTISIPFPFVTQGAVPVHVYDAQGAGGEEGCFVGGDEIAGFPRTVSAQDWTSGGTNESGVTCDQACGPLDGPNAARCTFDVTYEVPDSGMAYIQVHLDYGLKGVFADGNPCDQYADRYDPGALDETFGGRDALENNGTQDGPVRIANCQPYAFGYAVDGVEKDGDTVASQNEFKRIAGVLGLAFKSADGSGVAGAAIELVRGGKVVATAKTDADGFYSMPYRHKGKAASYLVRFRGERTISVQITLKANGYAEANFDLSSGIAATQTGTGPKR